MSTEQGRTVEHSLTTMSQVMLPHHANPYGIAHGGETMKLMDTAAGVAAVRHCHCNVVTARVEGINFYSPVRIGDLVTVNARLTFVSRATMEVKVEVIAEDLKSEFRQHALTAYFVMVALDDLGKPTGVPPLLLSTDEERQLYEQGRQRYQSCKGDISDGDSFNVCRERP